MTTFEEVADRVMENPLLFGGIVAGAVGVVGTYYLIRKWAAGGVCKFQARLNGKTVDSVRKFSAKILEEELRIDILINNAGIVSGSYKETPDGFESTFAVNHLGHFLLTNLLLDHLKDAPSARIINVGARLSKMSKNLTLITSTARIPPDLREC